MQVNSGFDRQAQETCDFAALCANLLLLLLLSFLLAEGVDFQCLLTACMVR